MNRPLWYSLTIGVGLLISAKGPGPGNFAEWPVNFWCCGLFAYLYRTAEVKERIEMMAVIAIAVPLELFCSEVWHIYEYQRGFMPLFVPPCHYFLFDFGRRIASKLHESWALPLLVPFIPFVGYGLWSGSDTSGLFMLLLVFAFTRWGPHPRLYSTMAWAALVMELWGTYLGNWTWANRVPWIELTAWNPPLLVGSFYCFGDWLVNLCSAWFHSNRRAPADV